MADERLQAVEALAGTVDDAAAVIAALREENRNLRLAVGVLMQRTQALGNMTAGDQRRTVSGLRQFPR